MTRKETKMIEVLLLFVGGGHAWMMIEPGKDPEDEIPGWCHMHNINENTIADYVVREAVT